MSFISKMKALLAVGALGVAAQGCIVVGGGGGGLGPYERGCTSSIDCAGAQFCEQSTIVVGGVGGGGFSCTRSCVGGGACPTAPDGRLGLCVESAAGGQCFASCFADRTCPFGYAAGMDSLGTCFCVPN